MMLPPPECSSIRGTAAAVNAWAVVTLNVKASRRSFVEVFKQGVRHGAADVVDDDVQLAEGLDGRLGELRGVLGVSEVGDDDVCSSADGPDLFGHFVELGLRPCGDDDVRARLRECQSHRGSRARGPPR